MSDDLLGRLRIELSRMETRLQSGKWAGLEQEFQEWLDFEGEVTNG